MAKKRKVIHLGSNDSKTVLCGLKRKGPAKPKADDWPVCRECVVYSIEDGNLRGEALQAVTTIVLMDLRRRHARRRDEQESDEVLLEGITKIMLPLEEAGLVVRRPIGETDPL